MEDCLKNRLQAGLEVRKGMLVMILDGCIPIKGFTGVFRLTEANAAARASLAIHGRKTFTGGEF